MRFDVRNAASQTSQLPEMMYSAGRLPHALQCHPVWWLQQLHSNRHACACLEAWQLLQVAQQPFCPDRCTCAQQGSRYLATAPAAAPSSHRRRGSTLGKLSCPPTPFSPLPCATQKEAQLRLRRREWAASHAQRKTTRPYPVQRPLLQQLHSCGSHGCAALCRHGQTLGCGSEEVVVGLAAGHVLDQLGLLALQ